MLDKQRYSQLSSARSFSIAVGLLVRGLTHQLTLQILVVDVDSIKNQFRKFAELLQSGCKKTQTAHCVQMFLNLATLRCSYFDCLSAGQP